MNIYYIDRNSKYKGPFDIMDLNRKRIIKVGDICLCDCLEGIAFLVVCESENSWKACKYIGIGNNSVLSNYGNMLLFSFDGFHKRKGNVSLIKQLLICYREKVIVGFFQNAIDILEYKTDLWDVSIICNLFEFSREYVSCREELILIQENISQHLPSVPMDAFCSEDSIQEIVDVDYDQSYLLSDFNRKEFIELLKQYHKGDRRAFEQLVKSNLKLVEGLVYAYKNQGVDEDDLVQEGAFGLMKAIERFTPCRNVSFSFYAQWWIRQAFMLALINMQSIVKIPANQVNLYKKIRKSIERYEQEHGYEPSFSEIDIETDVAPENIEFLCNLPDRLHKIIVWSNNWDELPSSDSADGLLMKESQSYYVNAILSKLDKREAYILRHIYGIGEISESLSSLGARMNLTRERIRQIAVSAVQNLREILKLRRGTSDEEESSKENYKHIIERIQKYKKNDKGIIGEKQISEKSCRPFVHQDEIVKKVYGAEAEPTIQCEVSEKDGLKVGDNIYYNKRYCTVRKIIYKGKSCKLIVEYSNGVQDYVPYKKSRLTISKSLNSSNNHK